MVLKNAGLWKQLHDANQGWKWKKSDGEMGAYGGFAVYEAKLKGSIGEGPNQTNYSDQSSVRILGIQRKPRKDTSWK